MSQENPRYKAIAEIGMAQVKKLEGAGLAIVDRKEWQRLTEELERLRHKEALKKEDETGVF